MSHVKKAIEAFEKLMDRPRIQDVRHKERYGPPKIYSREEIARTTFSVRQCQEHIQRLIKERAVAVGLVLDIVMDEIKIWTAKADEAARRESEAHARGQRF